MPDELNEQRFTQLINGFVSNTNVNAYFQLEDYLYQYHAQPHLPPPKLPKGLPPLHTFILKELFHLLGLPNDWNAKAAVDCYKAEADKEDALAQHRLGYEFGNGVDKDLKEAVKYYTLAANQGFAPGQTNLGVCYEFGTGVDQDLKEAVKYYTLAANQGYAPAQTNLAACYDLGTGVDQDLKEAVKYYTLAANQGYQRAQHNLGACYQFSTGVDRDFKKAVKYYRLAANKGFAQAQTSLGACYELGMGVDQDLKEAVNYYTLAANQGYRRAQHKLGCCYEYGKGVNEDLGKALEYYSLASMAGYELAKESRPQLLSYLAKNYQTGASSFPKSPECQQICENIIQDLNNNRAISPTDLGRLFSTPQNKLSVQYHNSVLRQDTATLNKLFQAYPAAITKLLVEFDKQAILAHGGMAPLPFISSWLMSLKFFDPLMGLVIPHTFPDPHLCAIQDEIHAQQALFLIEAEEEQAAWDKLTLISAPCNVSDQSASRIVLFLYGCMERANEPDEIIKQIWAYFEAKPNIQTQAQSILDSCLAQFVPALKKHQDNATHRLPDEQRQMVLSAHKSNMSWKEINKAILLWSGAEPSPAPVVWEWSKTLGKIQLQRPVTPVISANPSETIAQTFASKIKLQ